MTEINKRRIWRIAAGVVLWIAIASFLFARVHDQESQRELRAIQHARGWLFGERVKVLVQFENPVPAAVGDPVFFRSSERDLTLIGEVAELAQDGTAVPARLGLTRQLACRLYLAGHGSGAASLDDRCQVSLITVPQTAAWVVKTLLPKEKLLWIAEEWNRTLLEHREELFQAISPVLQHLVGDLERLALEDLPLAVERHWEDLSAIGQNFHRESIQKELLPALEEVAWPILAKRSQPALDAVGKEILARLPVWGFTWRFLYQSLPLTADDYVKAEWQRFVDQDVLPILKSHTGDFIGALQDVIAELSRHPKGSEALRLGFDRLLHDRELQHQIRLIFQEIVLDNPRFQRTMLDRWNSPELAQAIDRLSVFMGPLLAKVGDAVLGTRGGGITPEFARVLRTQILEKDRRWILIESGPVKGEPVASGHRFQGQVASHE